MKNMKNITRIVYKDRLLAFIIKASFKKEGLHFFTPDGFSQQMAYMKRFKGHVITSHIHPAIARQVKFSQEVLFVKSGMVRIDFYDEKKRYVESRIVGQGDVIFLASGGHGFEFLKDTEMIEIKQGPFIKNISPIRFAPVTRGKIKLKK